MADRTAIMGGEPYAEWIDGNVRIRRIAKSGPTLADARHAKAARKAETLERTALRLLKRAGRPEPNERYARIRKNLAAMRVDD